MVEHFRSMQKGLVNIVIGLSLALLIQAWPNLKGWAEHGLFSATFVALIHWHYGASFVLGHLGPSHRLGQELADSLAFFALLALPVALKRPEAWFALNAAAYAVAWIRYRGLACDDLSPRLQEFVRRKRGLDAWVFGSYLSGALLCQFFPGLAPAACWTAFTGNLAGVWFLSELWGLYDVEESSSPALVPAPVQGVKR